MFLIAVINQLNEIINQESSDMKARYSSSQNKLKITFLKQECFEGRFKDERDVVFLTESARLFHDNISAEKEKACSPYATEFTVRTVKSNLEDKRRPRCEWYCCRKEHISHIHAQG